MDRNQPPDEEPLDPRKRWNFEEQQFSSEELQRAAELALEAYGVEPRSDTSGGPDRASLGIVGGIIIGAILAARVTKIGSIEFAAGMPDKLPDVVEAAVKLRPL